MKVVVNPALQRSISIGCVLSLVMLLGLGGCGVTRKSGMGFRLPEGNIDKGKTAFVDLKCHTCHTVAKLNLPQPDSKAPFNLELGGEVLRVRTYGELVTSIINPTHIISEEYRGQLGAGPAVSPMPEFNKIMTVEQMIDLVAFLQSHYRLPPDIPVIAY